ncbi:hypothetical protein [Nocardia amamiensis]|uniref:hypothetical protein n=1 Tax=Nocardia amamiensis TaxID=404578 RepID=UPI000AF0F934|nr:hypothetical protein [Nocardia amamiensis]
MPGIPLVDSPVPVAAPVIVVLPGPRADTVRWGEHHTGARLTRGSRRWPVAEPEKPLSLHDSWWIVAAAGVLAASVLAAAVWISAHLVVHPVLHTAGLFVHLAALVVGFGGVLMADYLAMRWLAGRSTFAEALHGANRLHAPIWAGLVGLIASGCVLEPNLASTLTRIKLVLVLVLTLNGLQALMLSKQLDQHPSAALSPRVLAWAAATGVISQICWWGAVFIGFWNAEQ